VGSVCGVLMVGEGGELVQESHACPCDGGEGCEQDRQQIPEPRPKPRAEFSR